MAELKDIVYYLVDKYPHKDQLSNARITKMVYLADWYSANVYHKQVSNISWYFDNYGPFVRDVLETAKANSNIFSVKEVENYFGATKRIISICSLYSPTLSETEIHCLDRVIVVSKDKTWDQFITFVYSTYPIVSSERYTQLDLLASAVAYQKLRRES